MDLEFKLSFIHVLRDNYTYFGDNSYIYTYIVYIIGYTLKMEASSDLLGVGFRWITTKQG